jgi:hypothetical protein
MSLNRSHLRACRRCELGVAGRHWAGLQTGRGVTNSLLIRKVLEKPTIDGDSPVGVGRELLE